MSALNTPPEDVLKLLTAAQYHRMLANGRWNAAHVAKDGNTDDLAPVVQLFCPWGGGTWLLTELDPEDPDIAFGLCDLGMGSPELGSVRLSELAAIVVPRPCTSRFSPFAFKVSVPQSS